MDASRSEATKAQDELGTSIIWLWKVRKFSKKIMPCEKNSGVKMKKLSAAKFGTFLATK